MNEVTKVHLGRQAFTISASAHKQLRSYLDAIKKQGVDKEVLEEVEARMAELLNERGIAGEKVILVKDVDFLKEQLGTPKDFSDSPASEPAAENTSDSKRLFRDTDTAMIAGVASGLSKYSGIDVTLIRVLFVISLITGGWGIIVYIVLWLLVPEAKTSSDRLQMAGKSVTVDSLKEVVERADVKGAARRANNSIAGPINSLFRVILKAIGIIFMLSGLTAIFGLLAGASYTVIHSGDLLQENIFPVGLREHLLLDIAMVDAALLALFVILLGMAMFMRKWPVSSWITGVLIGLLFIGLAGGGALAADTVPKVIDRYNANTHSVTRSLKPFTSVNAVGDGATIRFKFSDKYYTTLNYFGNANVSNIQTTVTNSVLLIDSSNFDELRHCQTICIPDSYNMVIDVYSPNSPDSVDSGEPFPPKAPMTPVYQQ